MLMRWAHRSVPAEVQMQGEIYGIHICDTAAAFSSRYHAGTGAPGLRCRPLAADDLASPVFRQLLEREIPGIDLEQLSPGDLVPLAGGELFVSMYKNSITRIHADLNAAQNLQRRFWTRHGDPFRIPCRKVFIDGVERWVPKSMGKRILGSMGGYGWMVPTGHESGSSRWEALTPKKWKAMVGETSDEQDMDELAVMEEEFLETTGEVAVFFRDPSGAVLPDGLWYPAKSFWGIVKTKTASILKKS
jgi:hypothetical protein